MEKGAFGKAPFKRVPYTRPAESFRFPVFFLRLKI